MTTTSTAFPTNSEQLVADYGLVCVLDVLLQAEVVLLALLAIPTPGLPMAQFSSRLTFAYANATAQAEPIQRLTPQLQEQPAPSGLAFSVSRGARASQVRRLLVAGGGG